MRRVWQQSITCSSLLQAWDREQEKTGKAFFVFLLHRVSAEPVPPCCDRLWKQSITDPQSLLHLHILLHFQGQPGVMGIEGQPGLAGYTVSFTCLFYNNCTPAFILYESKTYSPVSGQKTSSYRRVQAHAALLQSLWAVNTSNPDSTLRS